MAKRGQNEGSIFKRDDGRWCAVLNLGYVRGTRRRKYFYGDTRRDVQAQLTKALRDQQQALPVAPERQTVQQFLEQWLQDVIQPTLRPATYTGYEVLVRVHIVPVLGRVQLARLTPQQVQDLMSQMRQQGLSARTIQYMRAVLRRALGQALKSGLVARNLEDRLKAGELWEDTGMVFTTHTGKLLEPRNINRSFALALKRAGLPPSRFLDLRHTAISQLIANGTPVTTAQKIAGHSRLSTTADIYTHVVQAQFEEAADRMGALLWDEEQPVKRKSSR